MFQTKSKIFATPAVNDEGVTYVGSQDDRFYAIGPDGKQLWTYRTRDDNDSSAMIDDHGTIYFGSDDRQVYALSPNGSLRWASHVGGYVRAPPALGRDGTVVVNDF